MAPVIDPPSPTKVMISNHKSDKHKGGGSSFRPFGSNKINPAPVYYAMVHPKPQAAASKEVPQTPSDTTSQSKPQAAAARVTLPDPSPVHQAAETPATSSLEQQQGPQELGRKRRSLAAMLEPLIVDMPSVTGCREGREGSVSWVSQEPAESSVVRSSEATIAAPKRRRQRTSGDFEDDRPSSGSTAMATAMAVATSALDASDDGSGGSLKADSDAEPRSVEGLVYRPSFPPPFSAIITRIVCRLA